MLIFGYGARPPKDRGPVAPLQCPGCHNLAWYHLVSQRSAVSLFFVPIIPVKSEDALVCEVCRYAIELTRPQAARAIDMIADSRRFTEGHLTRIEFGLLVDSFWATIHQQSPGAVPEGTYRRAGTENKPYPPTPVSGEPPATPPDPFA